jgi:hypothetical protein
VRRCTGTLLARLRGGASLAFFRRRGIVRRAGLPARSIGFAEAQLLKLVTALLARRARGRGGLGLRTQDVGLAYGTLGRDRA